MKINNKDMLFFWIGILVAVVATLLGNLLTNTAFDIAKNGYNLFNTFIFIVSATILVIVFYFIFKQIKKIIKLEESRNKK